MTIEQLQRCKNIQLLNFKGHITYEQAINMSHITSEQKSWMSKELVTDINKRAIINALLIRGIATPITQRPAGASLSQPILGIIQEVYRSLRKPGNKKYLKHYVVEQGYLTYREISSVLF